MVKDAPGKRAPVTLASYASVLRDRDTWWFMFFYSITFGGFVGLSSALPLYFKTWYSTSGVAAGYMVALVVFGGSAFRPIGGRLADRIGGLKTLQLLFVLVSLSYLTMAFLPKGPVPEVGMAAKASGWGFFELPAVAWTAVAVFFVGAMGLGMGNGSVFQLVPLRFRQEIGVITGLVGAAGGVGGFFLAKTLGMSRDATGDFTLGFSIFAGLALCGLFGIMAVKMRWRTTWGAVSGARV
jgi:NNP family nitrate/nitrite transporter-like MFS transporter